MLEEKIEEKKKLLEQKQVPIKKLEESFEHLKHEITPETMKKAYKFLETKSNEAVIFIFEALVGLMRGNRRADARSVELYTKKHEGFLIGLNKIDHKRLNTDFCQEHLNVLQDQYDKVLQQEELAIFKPFRNILSKLCLLALLGKDEVRIEESIQRKKDQLEKNIRLIEQKTMLLNNADIQGVISEDIQYYKTEQLAHFNEKLKRINNKLTDYKNQLANFEEKFFASLN